VICGNVSRNFEEITAHGDRTRVSWRCLACTNPIHYLHWSYYPSLVKTSWSIHAVGFQEWNPSWLQSICVYPKKLLRIRRRSSEPEFRWLLLSIGMSHPQPQEHGRSMSMRLIPKRSPLTGPYRYPFSIFGAFRIHATARTTRDGSELLRTEYVVWHESHPELRETPQVRWGISWTYPLNPPVWPSYFSNRIHTADLRMKHSRVDTRGGRNRPWTWTMATRDPGRLLEFGRIQPKTETIMKPTTTTITKTTEHFALG